MPWSTMQLVDYPKTAGRKVICLITPVEDATQMGRVQRHGIFCAMHYDRVARRKRGKIKKMAVIV